jgi:hypothetical protein
VVKTFFSGLTAGLTNRPLVAGLNAGAPLAVGGWMERGASDAGAASRLRVYTRANSNGTCTCAAPNRRTSCLSTPWRGRLLLVRTTSLGAHLGLGRTRLVLDGPRSPICRRTSPASLLPCSCSSPTNARHSPTLPMDVVTADPGGRPHALAHCISSARPRSISISTSLLEPRTSPLPPVPPSPAPLPRIDPDLNLVQLYL